MHPVALLDEEAGDAVGVVEGERDLADVDGAEDGHRIERGGRGAEMEVERRSPGGEEEGEEEGEDAARPGAPRARGRGGLGAGEGLRRRLRRGGALVTERRVRHRSCSCFSSPRFASPVRFSGSLAP